MFSNLITPRRVSTMSQEHGRIGFVAGPALAKAMIVESEVSRRMVKETLDTLRTHFVANDVSILGAEVDYHPKVVNTLRIQAVDKLRRLLLGPTV